MKRQEFIESLKVHLEKNRVQNISEILADYEEHFSHGLASGKTEEEVTSALGQPESIARAYETEKMIESIQSPQQSFNWGLAFKVVLRLLILAPFNFFVLLIPGVVIGSLILAAWALAVAIFSVGFAAFAILPEIAKFTETLWALAAASFAGLGLMGLGVVSAILMLMLSRGVLMMLISYLQWNVKFVTEK